jgi:site-specific DNA-cytosine methylase
MKFLKAIANWKAKLGQKKAELRNQASALPPQPEVHDEGLTQKRAWQVKLRERFAKRYHAAVRVLSGMLSRDRKKALQKTKHRKDAIDRARGKVLRDRQFEASVLSAYEAKADKVRAGVGKHNFIHPRTPSQIALREAAAARVSEAARA